MWYNSEEEGTNAAWKYMSHLLPKGDEVSLKDLMLAKKGLDTEQV